MSKQEIEFLKKVETYKVCVNKYVRKKSNKPFKSGLKENKVKEIRPSQYYPFEPAFVFYEDTSWVRCRECTLVQKIFYYL